MNHCQHLEFHTYVNVNRDGSLVGGRLRVTVAVKVTCLHCGQPVEVATDLANPVAYSRDKTALHFKGVV